MDYDDCYDFDDIADDVYDHDDLYDDVEVETFDDDAELFSEGLIRDSECQLNRVLNQFLPDVGHGDVSKSGSKSKKGSAIASGDADTLRRELVFLNVPMSTESAAKLKDVLLNICNQMVLNTKQEHPPFVITESSIEQVKRGNFEGMETKNPIVVTFASREIRDKIWKEKAGLANIQEMLREKLLPEIQIRPSLGSGEANRVCDKLYEVCCRLKARSLLPYKDKAYVTISRGEPVLVVESMDGSKKQYTLDKVPSEWKKAN